MIPLSFLQTALIIVNGVALIIFGLDKLQSKKKSWRIPESRLLIVAFFGPFGAYAGMLLFRHKTRKSKFLLVPVLARAQIPRSTKIAHNRKIETKKKGEDGKKEDKTHHRHKSISKTRHREPRYLTSATFSCFLDFVYKACYKLSPRSLKSFSFAGTQRNGR
jgi:uncharacterized membrane protein YsdA (DUF1294 family)